MYSSSSPVPFYLEVLSFFVSNSQITISLIYETEYQNYRIDGILLRDNATYNNLVEGFSTLGYMYLAINRICISEPNL